MESRTAQERIYDEAAAPPPAVDVEGRKEDPSQPLLDQLADESRRRERRLRRSLMLADIFALGVGMVVTTLIASPDLPQPAFALLFLAVVAGAKLWGLYDRDDHLIRKTTVEELPRLAQLAVVLTLVFWLGDDVLIGNEAGKKQALVLGIIFVTLSLLGRRAARLLAMRGPNRERCLFLGDRVSHARLSTIFGRHALSADLVGSVSMSDVVYAGAGASDPLRELAVQFRAHRLIIGPHGLSNRVTFELVQTARSIGMRVSLLPDMLEVAGSAVEFDDLFGVTLLGVRHSQLSRSSRVIKRAFDIVGATLLLIPTAPLMLAAAAAVRLDSRGPVFFRQQRIGRDDVPFRIWKLRTMIDGADKMKSELRSSNEADGIFKIADDPRVTRVGHFLRRSSLDELPQLFNVLQGSMSLVGPRPLVADEDGAILGAHRGRLALTPGMTGQWQIAGSARVPLEDMVKLDHLYVSNWTLWMDLKILLRTLPYMLGKRGL